MLKTKILAFTILYHYECCFSETGPLIHLAQSDYAFRLRAFRASTLHSSVPNTKSPRPGPLIIASITGFNIFFPENFKLIHLESPAHSMLALTQFP